MPNNIFVVTTPQLGVNDKEITLVKWYVNDEDFIRTGELLCACETAKASFDIQAEATGYVACLVDENSEVAISQPIALIGSDRESLKIEKNKYSAINRSEQNSLEIYEGTIKATQKAKDLAKRLGFDLFKIHTKEIIREQDVIQYYEKSKNSRDTHINISLGSDREPVVVYGAGRGAISLKECLDYNNLYQCVCFIDDDPNHPNDLCGLPIYNSSKLMEILQKGVKKLACAIANGNVRLDILKKCESLGIELINVIHPHCYISSTVLIGKGNYIKAGAVIETNSIVKNCCIIDNGAIIAHDNMIEDGCHIAPGAVLGSSIQVNELSIIGIGVSVATGVKIGRSVIVSVGSSVIKDVPDYSVVEGVPGKIVGERKL